MGKFFFLALAIAMPGFSAEPVKSAYIGPNSASLTVTQYRTDDINLKDITASYFSALASEFYITRMDPVFDSTNSVSTSTDTTTTQMQRGYFIKTNMRNFPEFLVSFNVTTTLCKAPKTQKGENCYSNLSIAFSDQTFKVYSESIDNILNGFRPNDFSFNFSANRSSESWTWTYSASFYSLIIFSWLDRQKDAFNLTKSPSIQDTLPFFKSRFEAISDRMVK